MDHLLQNHKEWTDNRNAIACFYLVEILLITKEMRREGCHTFHTTHPMLFEKGLSKLILT
jgi:hypothetical protein